MTRLRINQYVFKIRLNGFKRGIFIKFWFLFQRFGHFAVAVITEDKDVKCQ